MSVKASTASQKSWSSPPEAAEEGHPGEGEPEHHDEQHQDGRDAAEEVGVGDRQPPQRRAGPTRDHPHEGHDEGPHEDKDLGDHEDLDVDPEALDEVVEVRAGVLPVEQDLADAAVVGPEEPEEEGQDERGEPEPDDVPRGLAGVVGRDPGLGEVALEGQASGAQGGPETGQARERHHEGGRRHRDLGDAGGHELPAGAGRGCRRRTRSPTTAAR